MYFLKIWFINSSVLWKCRTLFLLVSFSDHLYQHGKLVKNADSKAKLQAYKSEDVRGYQALQVMFMHLKFENCWF